MTRTACIVAFAAAAIASAGTIVPSTCSTCSGSSATLTYQPISSTTSGVTVDLQLILDSTTYLGTGVAIQSVSIDLGTSYLSIAPLVTPTSSPTPSSWSTVAGIIGAAGCASGSSATAFCTGSSGLGASIASGTNTWTWQLQFQNGTMLTAPSQAQLFVRYVNANGTTATASLPLINGLSVNNFGRVSAPEPGSLFLIGAGLAGLAFLRKRTA